MDKMTGKKFKIGLVIGRFQPFHLGHRYLIEKALTHCDKIIIGIGSANKDDDKNPWSVSIRRKMLEEFVRQEKIEDRVVSIIDLYDNPDDDVWFANLLKKTGPFDVTLGNNEWNNGIIERHGIKAIYTGLYKRDTLEGQQIRTLMKDGHPWEDRVPAYIHSLIKA